MLDSISSLDLYLDYEPGAIVTARQVIDFCNGMYPIYYQRLGGDRYKVSTSVVSLIRDSKSFNENESFRPNYHKMSFWNCDTTIDSSIMRLKSFECVSQGDSHIWFNPKRKTIGKKALIEESVDYFKDWIGYFENNYPNYDHVIYLGGRDSRIVYLLPKKRPERWHVFSSEPNYPIVIEWFVKNSLSYNQVFTHSNQDDDGEYLIKKVIASDFMTNPEHLRWTRKACEIAEHFNKKCIFWLGNAGDTIYACRDGSWQKNRYSLYFHWQLRQTQGIQGMYSQTIFNLTGCPAISLYSAPALWRELYQHFEPSEFHGVDLRPELGDRIAGRNLDWSGDNPCPKAWLLDESTILRLRDDYADVIRGEIL